MTTCVFADSKHANGGCIFADPSVVDSARRGRDQQFKLRRRDRLKREDEEILAVILAFMGIHT